MSLTNDSFNEHMAPHGPTLSMPNDIAAIPNAINSNPIDSPKTLINGFIFLTPSTEWP